MNLVDKKKLCYEPISVKEFKSYVLDEATKAQNNGMKGKLEFNFISGYTLFIGNVITNAENNTVQRIFRRKNAPYNELVSLLKEYDGNRNYPIVQVIVMKLPEDDEVGEGENVNDYVDFYSTFTGIGLAGQRGKIRIGFLDINYSRFRPEETMDNFATQPKEGILSIATKVLNEATYPDYPYIRTSPEVTRAILNRRKICRDLNQDTLFENVFKPLETYANLVNRISSLISRNSRRRVLKSLTPELENNQKLRNEVADKRGKETYLEYDRLKDLLDKYKIEYIIGD